MALELSINSSEGLRFDSGPGPLQAGFPWIEIALHQEPPTDPMHKFGLHLVGVPWPAVWFSTGVGFTSSRPGLGRISDGDLRSSEGEVVRSNHELTARLGIMPVVLDTGLDAVMLPAPLLPPWFVPPKWEAWFSTAKDVFSETLGQRHHGDLLSEAGSVVRRYHEVLAPFCPQPPMADSGLDAATFGPRGVLSFSTREGFFSECLGVAVAPRDLLEEGGEDFRASGRAFGQVSARGQASGATGI
jgi:hypothetical protein